MFAVLVSYLKAPQLIVANLVSDGVTARILDTETLEGHLQKGGGAVGTKSYASIQHTFISLQLQLMDPNCWAGKEGWGDCCFQLLMLVKTEAFHSYC